MGLDKASDVALIHGCLAAEDAAFEALARRYHVRVRAYLSRFIFDASEVDDVAQESFLVAFRSLDRFDTDRPFIAWLLGIAYHQALTWLRTRQRRDQRETSPLAAVMSDWALRQANQAPESELGDELQALQGCLERLPSGQQELLATHYRDGRSLASLARERGGSASGMRMAVLRLRRLLRECIDRSLGLEVACEQS